MGPETCLDMSKGYPGLPCRQRAAKRTRRIALDQQQVARVERQQASQRRADQVGVDHWVGLTRTIQGCGFKPVQSMVTKFQAGMLPGDEQMRRLIESGKGMGDWTELDRFRARSDNERNTVLAQLSP